MRKILISLSVPSISISHDVYIPKFLRIEEVIPLLVQAAEDLSDSRYVSSGQEVLCLQEKNIILSHNLTIEQHDIKNGDHLVLL